MSTMVPSLSLELQTKWSEYPSCGDYRRKEVLGYRSLFHWHCGVRMFRVIGFSLHPIEGVRRLGLRYHICPVCETKEIPPLD